MIQLLIILLWAHSASVTAAGFTVLSSTPAPTVVPSPQANAAQPSSAEGAVPHNSLPTFKSLSEIPRTPTSNDHESTSVQVSPDSLAHYKALLENPMMKFAMVIVSRPEVLKDLETLINHPKKKTVFYCELVLMLFLILLRASIGSRIKTFLGRVGFSLATLVVYCLAAGWFIPGIVFGPPFYSVIKAAKSAAQQVYRTPKNIKGPEGLSLRVL